MPWVAQLRIKPKLTGGYDWSIGRWYTVTKVQNNVSIRDILDNKIVLTAKQAKNVFTKPQWVEQFDTETIAQLDKTNEVDDLKKVLQNGWNRK